jgi:hypothetical protein
VCTPTPILREPEVPAYRFDYLRVPLPRSRGRSVIRDADGRSAVRVALSWWWGGFMGPSEYPGEYSGELVAAPTWLVVVAMIPILLTMLALIVFALKEWANADSRGRLRGFQDGFGELFEQAVRPSQRQALLLRQPDQLRGRGRGRGRFRRRRFGPLLRHIFQCRYLGTSSPSIHSASRAETPI